MDTITSKPYTFCQFDNGTTPCGKKPSVRPRSIANTLVQKGLIYT